MVISFARRDGEEYRLHVSDIEYCGNKIKGHGKRWNVQIGPIPNGVMTLYGVEVSLSGTVKGDAINSEEKVTVNQ